ncbi:hypothetical protein GW17_00025103 [Ensete ventricosum]|nr:hypothetical protein GW17_00025103 [Ensete ventricosum]
MLPIDSIHGILDANRLTGLNFADWLYNIRIVLTAEKIAYVLDKIIPQPKEGAPQEEFAKYAKISHRIIIRYGPELSLGHRARVQTMRWELVERLAGSLSKVSEAYRELTKGIEGLSGVCQKLAEGIGSLLRVRRELAEGARELARMVSGVCPKKTKRLTRR